MTCLDRALVTTVLNDPGCPLRLYERIATNLLNDPGSTLRLYLAICPNNQGCYRTGMPYGLDQLIQAVQAHAGSYRLLQGYGTNTG